jgi:hypothetical protein
MNTQNFRVGDQARVIWTRTGEAPLSPWRPGAQVVVLHIINGMDEILDLHTGQLILIPFECEVVVLEAGHPTAPFLAYPLFSQLEKLLPPGSWDEIADSTGWKPGKTTQRPKCKKACSTCKE